MIICDNIMIIRISLVGQDSRFSPDRPGFKSWMRNKYYIVYQYIYIIYNTIYNTIKFLLYIYTVYIIYIFIFIYIHILYLYIYIQFHIIYMRPWRNWQRVGFQTRRLGVQIPLASFIILLYHIFYKKNIHFISHYFYKK